MKILITGGGGYNGTVLVNKLIQSKKIKQIIVVDTFWFGNYLKSNKKLIPVGSCKQYNINKEVRILMNFYNNILNLALAKICWNWDILFY